MDETIFGITGKQYALLLAKGKEGLPTNTEIELEDIDAVLTQVLPEYREMLNG